MRGVRYREAVGEAYTKSTENARLTFGVYLQQGKKRIDGWEATLTIPCCRRRAGRIDELIRRAMVYCSRFLNFNFILCDIRGRPITLPPSPFSPFPSIWRPDIVIFSLLGRIVQASLLPQPLNSWAKGICTLFATVVSAGTMLER